MQYVQLSMGYSALKAGAAFTPFMVPLVTLSVLSVCYAPRLGLGRVLAVGMAVIAVGFLCMLALEPGGSYSYLVLPTVVIGAGVGLSTAPATATIVGSLRDERQGIASAINDTTRELGAAVGIAVAGSVLAQNYTQQVTPRLPTLPDPLREQAADTLAKAVQIAESMGPQGAPIAETAQRAFVAALHSSTTVLAVMAAGSALLIVAIGVLGRASDVETHPVVAHKHV